MRDPTTPRMRPRDPGPGTRAARVRPRVLVATGGWIASGKSTVARCVADELGAPLIQTDRVRDALGSREQVHEMDWERHFAPGFTRRIYATALARAREALERGHPAVVDGCFALRAQREGARALAAGQHAPFLFVECRADPAALRVRLEDRARVEGVPARAWLELLDSLRARWEPVDELGAAEHLVLDTGRPLDESLRSVRERLAAPPPHTPSGAS